MTSSVSRNSFGRKLSIRITFAVLCTLALAFMVIAPAFREYARARQNFHDLHGYKQVLDAANALAAERGPANIAMSEDSPPDGMGPKRLGEIRARSDAALARLAEPPGSF